MKPSLGKVLYLPQWFLDDEHVDLIKQIMLRGINIRSSDDVDAELAAIDAGWGK